MAVGLARREMREHVRRQVAALQAEIETLRAELRRKRQPRSAEVGGWEVSNVHFTAVPLMSDGSKGPVLDLHPFFQRYHDEVSQ
jgi:hypothetical protein